ncbi:MAG: hypothetical protein Q8O03_08935 [Nanoarchaeota archaeon]|nr:hypothetical protein [Nanoarchaeota archaeon]
MEQNITYVGLKNLDSFEISNLQTLVGRYYPKIQRHFSNATLTVNIKTANVAGKRKRYTISLRVSAPSVILSVEHMDWELQRAVHRAFDGLENEAQHKFKVGVVNRRKKKFEQISEIE